MFYLFISTFQSALNTCGKSTEALIEVASAKYLLLVANSHFSTLSLSLSVLVPSSEADVLLVEKNDTSCKSSLHANVTRTMSGLAYDLPEGETDKSGHSSAGESSAEFHSAYEDFHPNLIPGKPPHEAGSPADDFYPPQRASLQLTLHLPY